MATSRSRAVDHLGFIGRTLEELTGFSTLAFELIQNADDSCQGARRLRFDLRDDALWVEDDGGFTDCERQDLGPDECPFLDTSGYRCDFHSFRLLSGRDKQARGDTTGAFGIGFTAVYQIADRPEIISGTRHWVVDETQPEESRITEMVLDRPYDGTRIVLPWAYDAKSPFRARIKAAPAPLNVRDQLEQALDEALAPAMLFLRHLEVIEIALNGEVVRAVTRTVEDDDVLIDDDGERRRWRLLRGDFRDEALKLRVQHDGRIESTRRPDVAVAIPIDFDNTGRVCATLPTAQPSGLPIHVNAELYLQSDRLRLGMGAAHQHDWNTAALGCAARLFADALGDLPDLLGPTLLWQAIRDARQLAQDEHPDAVGEALAAFWKCLYPEIPKHELVWTSDGRWVSVEDARYPQSEEEEVAFPVLDALGLSLVHPVLRPLQNTLRTVGVALLGVEDIAEALHDAGLGEALPIDQLPAPLDDPRHRAELWVELERLIGRLPDKQRDGARTALETVPVVPSLAGTLTTIHGAWRLDAASRKLLHRVAPTIPFLAEEQLPQEAGPLAGLCDLMTPGDAIAELDEASLDVSVADGRALVAWFAQRETDLSDDAKKALGQLAIFPSGEGIHALGELALPGGFEDPLDLALLVDRGLSREHEAFLGRLGVRKLSFATYAAEHIPRAFARGDLTDAQRRDVVLLLAQHKGQLDDEPAAHTALMSLDLVACTDSTWRQPGKVYLERSEVIAVLGPTYPFAVLPVDHRVAIEELLAWLGVADTPRPADVVARAQRIAEQAVTDQHRAIVERIVSWLGAKWPLVQPTDHEPFEGLRSVRWLPMRGSDAWHLPPELDLIFRDYLYGSQGRFLDLPRQIQVRSSAFLRWLGLDDNPTVEQVVDHLRYCAETDTQPNKEVYAFLNQNADADEITTLREVACLHIEGRWLKPSEVFWTDHPFGEWRRRLGHEFAQYRQLFDELGVQETPHWPQALAVMHDISSKYAPSNAAISGDDRSILLECWRLCDSALARGEISPDKLGELSGNKVVADDRGVLMRPSLLYFEDLPGLADELPGIRDHVIRRPDGAWRAMRAAGVEDLSKVAIANVVDVGSRLDSDDLRARLAEREEALARVIAPGIEVPWLGLSSQLRQLHCVVVRSLVIAWEIELFGKRIPGEPRDADALWQQREQALYIAVVDDAPVWEAVARELVRALLPDVEPATFALGIAAALGQPDVAAARRALDAAGYAQLAPELRREIRAATATDLDATEVRETQESSTGSGGDEDALIRSGDEQGLAGTEFAPEDQPTDVSTKNAKPDENSASDELQRKGESRNGDQGTGEAADESSGGEHSGMGAIGAVRRDTAERRAGRADGGDTGDGGPFAAGAGKQGSPDARRSRLRSYVAPAGAKTPNEARADDEVRTEVDMAGIAAVFRFEQDNGRDPELKPHNNKGFDVLSTGAEEMEVRYIEIKSTDGPWDDYGVGLTSAQFEHASDVGDQFWLYVVEHARSPSQRRIWPICNPARRVDRFMFDDGWRGLADPAGGAPAREVAKRSELSLGADEAG